MNHQKLDCISTKRVCGHSFGLSKEVSIWISWSDDVTALADAYELVAPGDVCTHGTQLGASQVREVPSHGVQGVGCRQGIHGLEGALDGTDILLERRLEQVRISTVVIRRELVHHQLGFVTLQLGGRKRRAVHNKQPV